MTCCRLSRKFLAHMASSPRKSLRTVSCTAAPQKADPTNETVHISLILIHRQPSGGAIGKPTTRARSAPRRNLRFPRPSFRRGSNASKPCAASEKKNAPSAMRKLRCVPSRSGKLRLPVTGSIRIYFARVSPHSQASGNHGMERCLSRFWMLQAGCKACNASILMAQSASSWEARCEGDDLPSPACRESQSAFARASPPARAFIWPRAGRSMWLFPRITFQHSPGW